MTQMTKWQPPTNPLAEWIYGVAMETGIPNLNAMAVKCGMRVQTLDSAYKSGGTSPATIIKIADGMEASVVDAYLKLGWLRDRDVPEQPTGQFIREWLRLGEELPEDQHQGALSIMRPLIRQLKA